MPQSAWKSTLALLLVATLIAPGCKKKPKGGDQDDGLGDGSAAADYNATISVVSLAPSTVSPNQPTQATVRGSGFKRGAQVFIGVEPVTSVTYESDRTLTVGLPGLPVGSYDLDVVNPDSESARLRGALTVATDGVDCTSLTVYFDLDSATLKGESVSRLTSAVECLAGTNASVRIEGHCDERGTTDYNLALGERRADAVQRWLVARGIAPSRVRTVSYGEERPVDRGHNEAAWSKNRRAEIRLEQ